MKQLTQNRYYLYHISEEIYSFTYMKCEDGSAKLLEYCDGKLKERSNLTKAGMSLYNDAKYIISYCRDSVIRAKNAMQENTNVIPIGISPMTPAQILVELWPKIHEICPEIKFQLVSFENTPENAKEILTNLGKNIDVVAGIFDETMFGLRQ